MPVLLDKSSDYFPPVEYADADGLLAVGGDLRPARILEAYRRGIFPWFGDDDPPLWWSPDPRFVLFPQELRVSRSMKRVLDKGRFEFRMDTAFEEVIRACQRAPRPGQDGTWITEEIVESYTAIHRMAIAHSGETWLDGELVGGIYGLRIGNVFCGESMFSKVSNSSKAAIIQLVRELEGDGMKLLDCQVHTKHLESLGGRMIAREEFLGYLTPDHSPKMERGDIRPGV